MDPQNVRPALQARKMNDLGCRKRLLRSDTQVFINHAFAGNTYKDFAFETAEIL
jgi:hypothetical protein